MTLLGEKTPQDNLFPNMCLQVGLITSLWSLVYYSYYLLLVIVLIMKLTDSSENILRILRTKAIGGEGPWVQTRYRQLTAHGLFGCYHARQTWSESLSRHAGTELSHGHRTWAKNALRTHPADLGWGARAAICQNWNRLQNMGQRRICKMDSWQIGPRQLERAPTRAKPGGSLLLIKTCKPVLCARTRMLQFAVMTRSSAAWLVQAPHLELQAMSVNLWLPQGATAGVLIICM